MNVISIYHPAHGGTVVRGNLTFEQIRSRYYAGAKGSAVPINAKYTAPQVIGHGTEQRYAIENWPTYRTDEEEVRGWIDWGMLLDWYYIREFNAFGVTARAMRRLLGERIHMFDIRTDGTKYWNDHTPAYKMGGAGYGWGD
jgi:hypothetical protein